MEDDDDSWWHQQDLEMQQQWEEEQMKRKTTANPYEGWSTPPRLTLEQYREVLKQKELRKQILSSTQLAKKFGVKKSDIANAWKQGYARYDNLLKEKN